MRRLALLLFCSLALPRASAATNYVVGTGQPYAAIGNVPRSATATWPSESPAPVK